MAKGKRSALAWVLAALVAVVLVLGVVMAFSGFRAFQDLRAARADLVSARAAVGDSPGQARADLAQASEHAAAAADRLDGPLWNITGAIPVLGATPRAAQAAATSLDQALASLQPLAEQMDVLNPASLVKNGTVDISAVEKAIPAVRESRPGVSEAVATLEAAPKGRAVVAPLREASAQLQTELTQVDSVLGALIKFGDLAGPLLGENQNKRYFVGVLNPNEVRGTGGFLGSWAIVDASNGKVEVGDVASNRDLVDLQELPAGLGPDFEKRYSDDAILRGNMNISPHFPTTSTIWLESITKKTGEQLDGAVAMDVVALGELVQASGKRVPLPDGGSLSGAELIDFALRGIYEKFPSPSESVERDAYQEAVSEAALDIVTAMPRPVAMAQAMGRAFAQGRVVVWSSDPAAEKKLQEAGIAGRIDVSDGHNVDVVAINASGSKLDAYLVRGSKYEVGRCVAEDGRVTSTVTVDLRSDVPLGDRPPEYMIGQAEQTRTGPINKTLNQIHLPNGAELTNVTLDGMPTTVFPFTEQGRPAVLVAADLLPRQRRTLTVEFTEPASDGPGDLVLQPLAKPQTSDVVDVGC